MPSFHFHDFTMLHLENETCGLFLFCSALVLACCRGQQEAPSQVITATAGETVVLPCYLETAAEEADVVAEWWQADVALGSVLVGKGSKEFVDLEHPSYQGRTSLPNIKLSDVSLQISDVRVSDGGTYECFISRDGTSSVKLIVGGDTAPVIEVISDHGDELVLRCASGGWHPEPEVLWLDSEGKPLPAGPAETLRGADDLYTVSSSVTVETGRSGSYTCRVQQRDTHHTRDARIYVKHVSVSQCSSLVVSCLAVGVCGVCAFVAFWAKMRTE